MPQYSSREEYQGSGLAPTQLEKLYIHLLKKKKQHALLSQLLLILSHNTLTELLSEEYCETCEKKRH